MIPAVAAGTQRQSARSLVRPVLTWVPSDDYTALDVAMAWHELLGGSQFGATCVWTTRPLNGRINHPAFDELCWHVVDLPARIDRHIADANPRESWSPWGPKSGPNYQFFSVLDAQRMHHDEEWVLFIEPDTHPLCDDVNDRIDELVAAHPSAWMMGGIPHTRLRPSLASDLWHHVNGAALYKVGDRDFARFRQVVWIPSLLLKIRVDPRFAFDCVTDPAQWDSLPRLLRESWVAAAHRFMRTAGMVNLSSLTLSSTQVRTILEDSEWVIECDDDAEPWMLHAKGDLTDIRNLLTPANRLTGDR